MRCPLPRRTGLRTDGCPNTGPNTRSRKCAPSAHRRSPRTRRFNRRSVARPRPILRRSDGCATQGSGFPRIVVPPPTLALLPRCESCTSECVVLRGIPEDSVQVGLRSREVTPITRVVVGAYPGSPRNRSHTQNAFSRLTPGGGRLLADEPHPSPWATPLPAPPGPGPEARSSRIPGRYQKASAGL